MIARSVLLAALAIFFLFWVPTPAGIGAALAGGAVGVTLGVFALFFYVGVLRKSR